MLFFIALCLTNFYNSSVPSQSCTDLPDHKLKVFIDWPYNLTCNDHQFLPIYSTSSECLINNGTGYAPKNFSIINLNNEDIKKNISYTLTSHFPNGSCSSWRVLVQAEILRNLSVKSDALHHRSISSSIFNNISVVFHKDTAKLKCINEGSQFYYPAGSYEINWYQTDFHKNGNVKDTYNPLKYDNSHILEDGKILQVYADFYQAGIYTCEVKYKGKTMLTSHTQVCVKQKTLEREPGVTCIDEVSFDKDEDRNITCQAHIDSRIISKNDIKVTWFRLTSGGTEEIICENTDLNDMKRTNEANCEIKGLPNKERRCWEAYNINVKVEAPQETLPISLLLKNLQISDAGNIYVKLEHFNKSSDATKVELNFNYLSIVCTVVSTFGALVVFVSICSILVYKYRHSILLKFRRHFGKYDKDNKEYVAILSYVYNRRFDQESRESVTKMIKWTKNLLEKKNYSYYDAQEHLELGPWAETFIRNLDRSHRMIVFMTAEYVQEAKARFETRQALENMRKNKTKIIVVKTKGAKQALKSSGSIKFKRELTEAMAGMRNVNYKHGMSETTFSNMLDYALPNLKRSEKHDDLKAEETSQSRVSLIPSPSDSFGSAKFSNTTL